MKITWKAVTAISASLTIAAISLGGTAEGSSTSVASQISSLQRKMVALQERVSTLENAPVPQPVAVNPPTTDIYFYTFDSSCKAPADIVTTIPLPSSVVCHLKVAYSTPTQ